METHFFLYKIMEFGKGSNRKKSAFVILNRLYNRLDRLPYVRHIFSYITLWNLGRELHFFLYNIMEFGKRTTAKNLVP